MTDYTAFGDSIFYEKIKSICEEQVRSSIIDWSETRRTKLGQMMKVDSPAFLIQAELISGN
jgi:hypothetical protein